MRVLIVDDHSLFRDGLASLLEAAGFEVVGEASDGEDALRETSRLHPDLVLLDINMPGMDGLETLAKLRKQSPETDVVMLTASEDEKHLFKSIRAGARGYLNKNLNSEEFVSRLRRLEQGEPAITLKTASKLMDGLAQPASMNIKSQPISPLSPKELELLPYISKGLSNKEISLQLNISQNTVKYHIKNILQKLNLKTRAEIAVYAVKNNLLSSQQPG